jgi:hypothetical protein
MPISLSQLSQALSQVLLSWTLGNALLFQAIWPAAVFYENWAFVLLCILFVGNAYWGTDNRRPSERLRAAVVFYTGTLVLAFSVEWAKTALGIWAMAPEWPAPWLLCIWLGLAATLAHSLSFLQSRPLIAAALGAISAPISYAAGAALNDSYTLASGAFPLVFIAIIWALLMPLLLAWAAYCANVGRVSAPRASHAQ